MGVHKYKWFLSVVALSSFLISDFHICSSLCDPRGFHLSRNTKCSIPPSLLLEGALLWLGWMMLRCCLVEVDTVWLRNQREVVTIRPLLTSFLIDPLGWSPLPSKRQEYKVRVQSIVSCAAMETAAFALLMVSLNSRTMVCLKLSFVFKSAWFM